MVIRRWDELKSLFVDPMFWRKGIGKSLLEESSEIIASKGFSRATLWVPKENKRARSLYHSCVWSDTEGVRWQNIVQLQLQQLEKHLSYNR